MNDVEDAVHDGAVRHRFVSANGARFHVAECGDGPLVLLLHGFPEFWWAWRSQLPALAAAGYRAAAMDLRGYGDSDKTPNGYDALTLATDVAGVVSGLGRRQAVLIAQGWGGYVGWAAAAHHPATVKALCAVAAPHPLPRMRALLYPPRPETRHLLSMQLPWLPERRIMRGDYIEHHLRDWSSPTSDFPQPDVVERYREALARWPSSHCALEYHRWVLRSIARADGRAFRTVMARRLALPVLQITGVDDPALPPELITASARYAGGGHQVVTLPACGHFPNEEAPAEFNRQLLAWLGRLGSWGAGAG